MLCGAMPIQAAPGIEVLRIALRSASVSFRKVCGSAVMNLACPGFGGFFQPARE